MKHLILAAFFSLLSVILFAQTAAKKNAVYFELGGNGLFTSLNYERQFLQQPDLRLRAGLGIYSHDPSRLTIPLGIDYLLKTGKRSFLDIGFGATYTRADVKLYTIVDHKDPNYVNHNYVNIVPSVGLRHHTENNLLWRISIAPVINNNGLIPFLGFSIGKMF